MSDLSRIADALERIADAFEGPQDLARGVTVKLDGRVISQEVVRHVLKQAARGPSGLTGGSLRQEH